MSTSVLIFVVEELWFLIIWTLPTPCQVKPIHYSRGCSRLSL